MAFGCEPMGNTVPDKLREPYVGSDACSRGEATRARRRIIRMSEPKIRDQGSELFILVRNSRPQNCSAVAQALRATVDGGSLVGSPDLLPDRNLPLIGIQS